jgi:hypothetical protein
VVTLTEYPKSKETPEGIERLKNQPGMVYLSPFWKLFTPFFYEKSGESHTYPGADYPQQIAALNREMVQALLEADAGILLGTDAWQSYHIPGFSIHEELGLLVKAGLTPYEALEAGTRNAAAALGKLDEFGTVATGKRADLILLRGNPLEDVANAQDQVGVMVNGRFLPQAQLQFLLAELVDSYKPNLMERLWPLGLILLAIVLKRQTDHHSNG